jgi:head-tail adaptor
MTLSWDPQDDFLESADGLEAVTLASVGGATTAVSSALRLRITEQEAAASGGRYTRRDVRWHLPAVQVATAPQVGATISDGQGQTWTIRQVDHDTRSSRWRCWCRLVQLSAVLDDRIHVQQASWSKDDHGGLVPTWSNWKTDLPARVQPVEAAIAAAHEQRYVRATHVVYLTESLELNQNHRLLHPATGTALHMILYETPEQTGGLFTIRAVKTPWVVA